ncbi:MAG: CinA family nicotinamide mononucleotide deamidase-related protein [Elusimicrobia bacterium]|nr:CinA family nicotinamide mononucleotide deamidase-related protein [Elusimicrobiota bacterium]
MDQGDCAVEAIHVGTELLTFRTNTHTVYLAQMLAPLGLKVARAVLVADGEEEIAGAINLALSRSHLVIVTGGLGPTFDDLSREACGRALGRGLSFNSDLMEKIKGRFKQVGISMPQSNKRQAMILDKALVIENEAGTAPGQLIDLGEKMVLLLPGPPKELENTLSKVLSKIKNKFCRQTLLVKSFQIVGHTESRVEEMAGPILTGLAGKDVEPTILASSYVIDLIFRAAGDRAAAALDQIGRDIGKIFGPDVLGQDGETLENKVGQILKSKNLTLAVAESCTGGLIADKITNIAGSTAYFLQSVVAYANEAKTEILGVSPEILKKHGAVSAEAAREMAQGMAKRSGADYAISVTGICGPLGGTPEKPLGLAYFGLARKNGQVKTEKRIFSGDRLRMKEKMAYFALDFLRRDLNK